MFTFSEQFSKATKDNLDAQLEILSAVTNETIKSAERVAELNLALAKTSLEESNATVKQLLSAKDPQEFFSVASAHIQPNADKTLTYARHFTSITSNAQTELTKVAEAHVTDLNRKTLAFVEELFKNAPAGSENVASIFKSAIGSAIGSVNAGYEQINKSTKQAAEMLEANLNTVKSAAHRAGKKGS